jgi:hypothetical protein
VTLSGLSGTVCGGAGHESKRLDLATAKANYITGDKAKHLAARLVRGFPGQDFVCFKAEMVTAKLHLTVYLVKVCAHLFCSN